MSTSPNLSRQAVVIGMCVLALAAAPARTHAGINVGLTPATQSVTPGTDFDVFIDVTGGSSSFNGFDMVVGYDPNALTFVPLSPTTLQQGCLMTGGCSAACGNTFHLFAAAGDSLSVSDVLLCNQVALTGPGRLYQLRFHASSTVQITALTVRRTHFYNAGLFVTPVSASGCQVGIGVSLGVGTPRPGATRPLRVEPNPAFGRVQLVSEDEAGGWVDASVLDLQGRVLRRLGPVWLAPQARLTWDGRDADGARVPAGLYLVQVRRAGQVQNARVILLP